MAFQGDAVSNGPELKLRVVFRADASLKIGTGHVMRCLTLAGALTKRGASCQFICRAHRGHLLNLIRCKGYEVHVLPEISLEEVKGHFVVTDGEIGESGLAHGHWLGSSQAQDVAGCAPILAGIQPDWVVVDHYALDINWERALAPYYRKLMAIDDLADRGHACDLLLDQTYRRDVEDYRHLVPESCRLLCGSQYALLRPEFSELRFYSLQRRRMLTEIHQLLITMGGIDKDNITGQVLGALRGCPLPVECEIVVIMGAMAPWQDAVRDQAREMQWATRVLVGVDNMAQLMAESDLIIGAAGATAWERCCLGVPTIMLVLAENQRGIGQVLSAVRAAHLVDTTALKDGRLVTQELVEPRNITDMSRAAAAITDGLGASRVADNLTGRIEYEN